MIESLQPVVAVGNLTGMVNAGTHAATPIAAATIAPAVASMGPLHATSLASTGLNIPATLHALKFPIIKVRFY